VLGYNRKVAIFELDHGARGVKTHALDETIQDVLRKYPSSFFVDYPKRHVRAHARPVDPVAGEGVIDVKD